MTTLAGQCLKCGYGNLEGTFKCVRCEAVLFADSNDDAPPRQSVIPWIVVACVIFFTLAAMVMRPNAPAPAAPASSRGLSSIESSDEPPPEEQVTIAPVISGAAPAAPPALGATPAEWRAVVNAQGTGTKKTASFPITARFWRIRWATTPAQDANAWTYAIIYRRNRESVGMAVNTKGESGGVTRLQGRGTYYLEVKSTQNWTMNIEQWN